MLVAIVQGHPYSGALAYALERALVDRTKIRVVSVGPDAPHPDIPLDTVIERGDPLDVLMRCTAEADVLVMQSPDSRMAGVGDVLMAKLRTNISCLLVEVDSAGEIIRASGPTGWHYASPPALHLAQNRVTVGVDGSATSDAAVAWATEFALAAGATLQIISAYPTPSKDAGTGWTRANAARAVAKAADVAGVPVAQTHVVAGEPVDVLLNSCADSSLLVVGRSALGAVGDACAGLAPCPVVIVP